jgi:hypothetical protein
VITCAENFSFLLRRGTVVRRLAEHVGRNTPDASSTIFLST